MSTQNTTRQEPFAPLNGSKAAQLTTFRRNGQCRLNQFSSSF
jgi:hypothetical protein